MYHTHTSQSFFICRRASPQQNLFHIPAAESRELGRAIFSCVCVYCLQLERQREYIYIYTIVHTTLLADYRAFNFIIKSNYCSPAAAAPLRTNQNSNSIRKTLLHQNFILLRRSDIVIYNIDGTI